MEVFRRSLIGYSRMGVSKAVRQIEANHQAALEQIFQELREARAQHAGLQSQLDRLHSELDQTDRFEALLSEALTVLARGLEQPEAVATQVVQTTTELQTQLQQLASRLAELQAIPAAMSARLITATRRYQAVLEPETQESLRAETTA